MKLSHFYNHVAALVDTDTTKINVAETKRVLSAAFAELEKLDAAELADTIAKSLTQVKKKRGR